MFITLALVTVNVLLAFFRQMLIRTLLVAIESIVISIVFLSFVIILLLMYLIYYFYSRLSSTTLT